MRLSTELLYRGAALKKNGLELFLGLEMQITVKKNKLSG